MKLIGNTWDEVLQKEYNKIYFNKLLDDIEDQYNRFKIYPAKNKVFSAFRLTDYNDVKVVILGQDPYHGEGQAHGVSFSVMPGVPVPPSLVNIYKEIKEEELLQIVGSIESKSTHPIGKAFIDYMKDKNLEQLEVEDFENITGYGIIAKVKQKEYILGNSKILEKYSIKNIYEDDEKKLAENGNSIVYVVEDKQIIAIVGVNDIVKENAKELISVLNKNKIETVMLTGDNKETAEKIAKDIGITKVIANVLPEEKAKVIKELKKENRYVLMCGDGINDSPALASSDIGVSVNTGTDIAMDSSDVILTKNNLISIMNLITISKNTIRNIKQNLFWAFFYNALMIPIACGLLKPIGVSINPMIASLAMVLSSLTVILNALRLKRIRIDI